MNSKTKVLIVDGVRHKITSICCIAIFENCHWKEFNFDEPILYLQCRRKRPNKKEENVKEYVFPLSKITFMS